MRFSEAWLREWVDPPVDSGRLLAQLTMAGLEVEAVQPVSAPFTGVVVGEVLAVEAHPGADRLRVCRVRAGGDEVLQIVCGAANVRPGLRVPLARIGAELPGGLRIAPAKLRGVESSGMLCSARELGMAETSEGLLELDPDAPLGADVRQVLDLDDHSIELSLTPNRGDCLSIAGVAREVAAVNGMAVTPPASPCAPVTIDLTREVRVEHGADCPRYVGRVVQGIDPRAVTPLWLRERLRRSGLRSLGPVVDVTNHVLLELGQPLHAFDLACLEGDLQVRRGREGERLVLLDAQEIALDAGTLVIADARGPVALAGIMGGSGSAVGADTRAIFLECAFFPQLVVGPRARALGLTTDSSQRFERGVSPALQVEAIERATALILDIAGGQAGPIIECVSEVNLPSRPLIALRRERIRRILGWSFPDSDVEAILDRLGIAVVRTAEGWLATPPPHRFDLAIEVDLIEELVRVAGYECAPESDPLGRLAVEPCPENRPAADEVTDHLVARGWQEVITYSFVEPSVQAILDPALPALMLDNPISSDLSALRTTLWGGLLNVLRHNQHRQQGRQRIFEIGMTFIPQHTDIKQNIYVSGACCGSVFPEQWGVASRGTDFYDLKAEVEAVLALRGVAHDVHFRPAAHPALHPGQCAAVLVEGEQAGWVGMLHPDVAKRLDLETAVGVFELRLDSLAGAPIRRFAGVSRFPAVRRDLALVVSVASTAADLMAAVRSLRIPTLTDLRLFDVYTGKGIEEGKKSIALGLIFQDKSRTLTDEEVDASVASVVAVLGREWGAVLRV